MCLFVPVEFQVFVNGTHLPDMNLNGTEPKSWTNPLYVPVTPTLSAFVLAVFSLVGCLGLS
jgi:hypothetical protein